MSRLGRFAADRRGRVPFAVIAALLLVSSAAFASSVPLREEVRPDRSVDDALDRVGTTTRPLLRAAVADAARDAAAAPVITPGETAAGRALTTGGDPFRDALRLRIYLHARHRLDAAAYEPNGLTARASLPPIRDAGAIRTAIRRVDIAPIDGGRAIRVRFRNVSLQVRDGERRLAQDRETYLVTVATPVLTMHERTREFERRLDAGPLDGPGLGRQLTARLYPVAWARGGLQYAGAPIQNVVTNRHVALATNGGVLASQRAAFGTAAPESRRAYDRALVQTGTTDIFELTPAEDGELLRSVTPGDPLRPTVRPLSDSDSSPSPPTSGLDSESAPDDELTVGVNRSADIAALTLVADDTLRGTQGEAELSELLADEYRVDATLETTKKTVVDGAPSPRPPAGSEWRHEAQSVETWTRVEPAGAPLPAVDGKTVAVGRRRVTVERVAIHTWRRGNETRRTTDRWTTVHQVGFVVAVDTDAYSTAPERAVAPVFTSGGTVGGPNLAGVPERARERLLADNGGADAIARAAVRESSLTTETTISVAPSPDVRPWVEADLLTLSRRVRNVSVTVTRGDVASSRANPAVLLAGKLRSQRGELLAVPDRYDGVADRARIAARSAYLDRVLRRLTWRVTRHRLAAKRLNGVLTDRGVGSMAEAGEIMDARADAAVGKPYHVGSGRVGTEVALVPDPAPAYLTLAAVPQGRADSDESLAPYHPLVARNINVFTVPYGDAVDAVVDADATRRVDLGTAGRVLVATERALDEAPTPAHRARRNTLRREVRQRLDFVDDSARQTLDRHSPLDAHASMLAVEAAADRWPGAGARAAAVTNGSFAPAVAREAASRVTMSENAERELRLRLRVALGRLAAGHTPQTAMTRVPVGPVRTASKETRSALRAELKAELKARGGNLTSAAARRAFGDRFKGVPAGLPLLPIPGYWVATINIWHVEVRGEYARFTLRAREGNVHDSTTYVRDGSAVEVDINEDGTPERLGWSDRVAFETETVVLVAVPPSGRGVGDTDGNAHEPSAGWPCPGKENVSDSCLVNLAPNATSNPKQSEYINRQK